MVRSLWRGGIVAACLLAGGIPASAEAACTTSTEHSQNFSDPFGDDEGGLAPDIGSVIMVTTANCRTGGSISLTDGRDSLIEGESVGMYYDTDNNLATGSPTFKGADRVVITIGHSGADSLPAVGTYNAATGKFEFGPQAEPIDVGAGGWGWGIDNIGFQPTNVGVYTIAMYEGNYDSYADFSPEPGSAAHKYPVAFSTEAPAPAPAPAAPAPSPPPAPPTTEGVQETPAASTPSFICKPGNLRGLKLGSARSKATARGCDIKVKFRKASARKRGRVITSSVKGDTVTIVVGRRAARASASRATGDQLAAKLTVEDLNRLFIARAAGRSR